MRQCLTILIGLVVLLSTTGLPRVQHLCGGIVQSAGIWIGGASGCNHEMADVKSCSHDLIKQVVKKSSPSCCKKPSTLEASKKDCCTDQVEWEPSQLDIAFGDQLSLRGSIPFGYLDSRFKSLAIVHGDDVQHPDVRPPPPIPILQTRRRALIQVYRC